MAFERPRYGSIKLAIDSVLTLEGKSGLRFARVQTAAERDGMQGQRLGLQSLYEEPEVAIERYDAEGFNIVEEMKKRSDDLLWVRARAIDAEKVNENGDFFPWDEFIKPQHISKSDDSDKIPAYKTFEGCHIFTNHKNDDVEKSHGQVVFAELDEENKCIWCTFYVDAGAYPQLARGIREGYITDVSMGCQVQWSACSVCDHEAKSEKEWCDHLKQHKGKRWSGKIESGKRKGAKVNDELVYEINHDIKFIELSVVGDGAFKGAIIDSILPHNEIIARVASLRDKTNKLDRLLTSGMEDPFARYASVLTVDDIERMEAVEELHRMLHMADQMTATLMERNAQVQMQPEMSTPEVSGAGAPSPGPSQPPKPTGNLLDTLTNVLNKMEAVIINLLERKDQIDLKHVQNLSKSMAETQQTMSDMIDDGIGQESGGFSPPPAVAPQAAQQPEAQPQGSPEYTSAGGVGSMMAPTGFGTQQQTDLSSEPFQVSQLPNAIPGAIAASVMDLDELRVLGASTDALPPQTCAKRDNDSRGGLKMANSIYDYTATRIMQRRAAKVKQQTEVATDDDRYRVVICSDGSVSASIDGHETDWNALNRITDEDIQDIRDEKLPVVAQRLLDQFVKDASSGRVAIAMAEPNTPKTTVQEHQIEGKREGNPTEVQEHQIEGKREGNPTEVQEHQIAPERKGNPAEVQEHQVEVMREGNPTNTQEQQLEAVRKGVDERVGEHRLETYRASKASPDRVISATIDGISRAVVDSMSCPSDVLDTVHGMAKTPDAYSAKIVAAASEDGFKARRAKREQARCNMRTAKAEPIADALMGRLADVLYNDPTVEIEDVAEVLSMIASEPVDKMRGFVEKRVQKIASNLDYVPEFKTTERDRGQSLRGALYAEIAKDDDGQMDVESVEAAISAIAETAYATTMIPTDMFRIIAAMEDGPTVAMIEAARTEDAVSARRNERESKAWWAAIGMVKESSNANRQVADLLIDNLADVSLSSNSSSIKIWKAAKRLAEGKRQAHQLVTRAVAAKINSDDMDRNAIDMTSRQEQTFTVTLAADEVGVDPSADGFEDAVRDKTISFLQASNHQVDPNTFQFTELDISPDGMVTGTIRSSTTKRTSGDRLNAAPAGGEEPFDQGLSDGYAATESLMTPMALQRRRNIREAMVRAAQGMPMPAPGGGGAPGAMMPPGMGGAEGPGLSAIAPPGENPMGESPEEPGDDMDKMPNPGDVKPIGTVCPACGSLDTKLAGGEGECQSCGSKYKVKVSIEDINVPEPGGKAGPAEVDGEGESEIEGLDGLGAMTAPGAGPMAGPPPGAPAGGGAPGGMPGGMPMAASVQWYTGPEQFLKVAEFKESGMRNAEIPGQKPAGMLCVLCGNHDVETIDGTVYCTACDNVTTASVRKSKHKGWIHNEVKVLLAENIKTSGKIKGPGVPDGSGPVHGGPGRGRKRVDGVCPFVADDDDDKKGKKDKKDKKDK